jgi:hypothetical protein
LLLAVRMIDAFSEQVLWALGSLLLLSECWGVHLDVHWGVHWEVLGGMVRRRGVDCELEVLDYRQMEFGSK